MSPPRTLWADALMGEPGMRDACAEDLPAVVSAIVSVLPRPAPSPQLEAVAVALQRKTPLVRSFALAPVPFLHLAESPLRRLVYAFGFALSQQDPALAASAAHLGNLLHVPIVEGRELALLVLGVRVLETKRRAKSERPTQRT